MGGGRTLKFDCTGNEVLVCYEELARGWSNESEKVEYCEGIIILTLLVLLGITLHLNRTVNSPGGGIYFKPIWGGTLFNVAKKMVLVLHKELEYEVEKFKYKKLEVM